MSIWWLLAAKPQGGGGGGGGETLAETLALGATTGGTDLLIGDGDQLLLGSGDGNGVQVKHNSSTWGLKLAAGQIQLRYSGGVTWRFVNGTGSGVPDADQFYWASGDTGLERVSAAVVGVTDGSTGTGTIEIVGSKIPFLQWDALQGIAPSSNFATLSTRNGHRVLEFDDTTQEGVLFDGVLPHTYSGAGLTVDLYWLAASATTGAAAWDVSIESHTDDADDLDSDSFAAANSGSSTTASATGEVKVTTITFTDGADMDSLAAGESFRLKVERDADGTNNTDDMSGDAQLLRVTLRET